MELQNLNKLLEKQEYSIDVELELIQLYKNQFYHYDILGAIDLAMNYVQLKDQLSDYTVDDLNKLGLNKVYHEVEEIISILTNIVNDKAEKIIYEESLRTLKKKLSKYVEILVAYNDQLEAYEMLLDRNSSEELKVNNEQLVSEMMGFIFRDKDKMLINQRVKEILRILPVRMTKERLVQYIEESLSVYYGGYESDLDDFLKNLRETLNPSQIDGYGEIMTSAMTIFSQVDGLDLKETADEEINKAKLGLKDFGTKLELALDICQNLTEIVNKALVLMMGPCFTFELLENSEEKMKHVLPILDGMLKGDDIEEVMEHLVALEGVGETWREKIQGYERCTGALLENKKDFLKEAKLFKKYEMLKKVQILFSPSIFADMDEYVVERGLQLDKGALRKKILAFNEEVLLIYKDQNRELARCKVNQLLYMLPIIKESVDGLAERIAFLLGQVTRTSEKSYIVQEFNKLKSQYES